MNILKSLGASLRKGAAAAYAESRRRKDSLLHPVRHWLAKRRVRGLARPEAILVVCHGNVCRSPYLEAVLRRALPDVLVSSAGFIGPGRTVPEQSMTIASRRGLDLSAHRSRLITREMLRRASLVLVMDARQRKHVGALGAPRDRVLVAGDLDDLGGVTRTIRDPWGASLDVFESSYARLDRCASTLAATLAPAQPRP